MKLIARTALSNPNNDDKATYIFIKLFIVRQGYWNVSGKFLYPDRETPITYINTSSKELAEATYETQVRKYLCEGYNIEEKEL